MSEVTTTQVRVETLLPFFFIFDSMLCKFYQGASHLHVFPCLKRGNPGGLRRPCQEVLKVGGVLWIAEVRSRFDGSAGHASVSSFLAVCAQLGFVLKAGAGLRRARG